MKCPICKKNISSTALKCPYCKTRTGLLCSECNTVNPVGTLVCKKCGQELLKICSRCKSVNFPSALKCRKCGSPFGNNKNSQPNAESEVITEFTPQLCLKNKAVEILIEGLKSKDQKIFSITGEKGLGKTS